MAHTMVIDHVLVFLFRLWLWRSVDENLPRDDRGGDEYRYNNNKKQVYYRGDGEDKTRKGTNVE